MKKIIYQKYDKSLIGELPRVSFNGRIVVVLSEQEANRAVEYLLSRPILGFDTETRPSFRRGHVNEVALMQVSDERICFLFRLNLIGMLPCVVRLLEDTTVPKVGLSLHDDLMMLHRRGPFKQGWFIDLQDLVGEIGIEDRSLQKLYANIFNERIVKRQQLSNWEAPVLNDKQKSYAATDAWTCIKLYQEVCRLRETGDYEWIAAEEEPAEDDK